jgi:CDP-4-dehydro-6-deoxyglucose reductase
MLKLNYNGQEYALHDKESVLDCLLRNNEPIPHSCKTGICQSCLVQAVESEVPAKAAAGLKPTLQVSGHALACQWIPASDSRVKLPGAGVETYALRISELLPLNDTVMRARLTPAADTPVLDCRAGQYLNLINEAGIVRSYSVANDLQHDGFLEFHIGNTAQGLFTSWLWQKAQVGDTLTARGPAGTCFYHASAMQSEPLLLAGTGTGLAPLYGIVRDALRHGHKGPITLVHGCGTPELMYYQSELTALAAQHANLHYVPLVRENPRGVAGQCLGDAEQIALELLGKQVAGTTLVYLCGNPLFVQRLRKQAFLRGVKSANIYCDAFIERSVNSNA